MFPVELELVFKDFATYGSADGFKSTTLAGVEVTVEEDNVEVAGNYTLYCFIENEVNNITISKNVTKLSILFHIIIC